MGKSIAPNRLRAIRTEQNLTIARVAALAGLGHATIEEAQQGANVTYTTQIRIAQALGLKPVDIWPGLGS